MWVDKKIQTVELPKEIVEHLKEVEKYMRNELGGGCTISVDGMVKCIIFT